MTSRTLNLYLGALRGERRNLIRRRNFTLTISYAVERNLSRLTAQREASVHAAPRKAGKEAERRLDERIAIIERSGGRGGSQKAAGIRADLERVRGARESVATECAS